jgi:hypothetical protein
MQGAGSWQLAAGEAGPHDNRFESPHHHTVKLTLNRGEGPAEAGPHDNRVESPHHHTLN